MFKGSDSNSDKYSLGWEYANYDIHAYIYLRIAFSCGLFSTQNRFGESRPGGRENFVGGESLGAPNRLVRLPSEGLSFSFPNPDVLSIKKSLATGFPSPTWDRHMFSATHGQFSKRIFRVFVLRRRCPRSSGAAPGPRTNPDALGGRVRTCRVGFGNGRWWSVIFFFMGGFRRNGS